MHNLREDPDFSNCSSIKIISDCLLQIGKKEKTKYAGKIPTILALYSVIFLKLLIQNVIRQDLIEHQIKGYYLNWGSEPGLWMQTDRG